MESRGGGWGLLMSRQVNPNADMPIMQMVSLLKVRTLLLPQPNSVDVTEPSDGAVFALFCDSDGVQLHLPFVNCHMADGVNHLHHAIIVKPR